jgi:hypothetical protein
MGAVKGSTERTEGKHVWGAKQAISSRRSAGPERLESGSSATVASSDAGWSVGRDEELNLTGFGMGD